MPPFSAAGLAQWWGETGHRARDRGLNRLGAGAVAFLFLALVRRFDEALVRFSVVDVISILLSLSRI